MKSDDPAETAARLVNFLQNGFSKAGFSRATIGMSGGVDSATAAALTVRALGAESVYPALLPYGALSTEGVLDAMTAVTAFGIPLSNVTRIDIAKAVDAVTGSGPTDQLRRGNVMARIRMVYIFDQAKKRNSLVVGTENRSEHLLGYYTRFGDEGSDIEPLRGLYKTEVYALARAIGVPESIVTKLPTAGLWAGQTDEGELGFDYASADRILEMVIDRNQTPDEVVAAGIAGELVTKVLQRVKENDFKHRLPIIPDRL
ncbi:NAD(+) synthase [Candidatus Gottesmanbacteria bacterium RBG_16_52_11]|uniref:NH(3)-dependent NAD(+) synthetase n=1 Tax=Candidatus Gottesmanbacteria bacterium RBG_16_52_11 TaxID=1798374 RepID=A0A1F5YNA2_9BACT|nr:MAG: NAD(+) synthase [Candidatus Gottesmanbacteria bacterium RBG_16_52_11]